MNAVHSFCRKRLVLPIVFLSVTLSGAATNYVALTGGHVPPFETWATAATTIQAAVEAAVASNIVLVSNGVYAAGGAVTPGYAASNRVVVTGLLTVRSLNGPAVTTIAGVGPRGPGALRCAYLANSAALLGFTLTNGATPTTGDVDYDRSGGAAFCRDSARIEQCVICGNAASIGGGIYFFNGGAARWCIIAGNSVSNGSGGGVYVYRNATIENCVLANNTASAGGGAYLQAGGILRNCHLFGNVVTALGGGARLQDGGTMINCTVIGNYGGLRGGGTSAYGYFYTPLIANSIIYYNDALRSENHDDLGNLSYMANCSTPLMPGTDHVTAAPQLAGLLDPHLCGSSPCIDAGTNLFAAGVDIDHEARTNGAAVDIGCDEYVAAGLTGTLTAALLAEGSNVVADFALSFTSMVRGKVTGVVWTCGDGSAITGATALTYAWPAAGTYPLTLRAFNLDHPTGVSAAVTMHIAAGYTTFVARTGGHVAPFTSWGAAATNVQDAINACAYLGGTVLLTDGVYQSWSDVRDGQTNCIAVEKAIYVRSVNGPRVTRIAPARASSSVRIRCAYLAGRAELCGIMLSNGYLHGYGAGAYLNRGGTLRACIIARNATRTVSGNVAGGVHIYNRGVAVDCEISQNTAYSAGGIHCYYGGLVSNCAVMANTVPASDSMGARGGGVALSYGGEIRNCLITRNYAYNSGAGGYCVDGLVEACVITNNTTPNSSGGGLYVAANDQIHVRNCLIADNRAWRGGGLALGTYSFVDNCTIWSNIAPNTGGVDCDLGVTIRNSIIYANTNGDVSGGSLTYCCTPAPIAGAGNITNAPLFVWPYTFDLATNSPCRDAGTNLAWMAGAGDCEGNPRIVNGTADIGAYELGGLLGRFIAQPRTVLPGETVTFAGAAVGTNVENARYAWDFDNSGSFEQQDQSKTETAWQYADEGIYSVRLVVSNAVGEGAACVRHDYISVVPEPALWGALGLFTIYNVRFTIWRRGGEK